MNHYSNLTYIFSERGYEFNFCSPIYTECELIDYDAHIQTISMTDADVTSDNVVRYLKEILAQGFYIIVETNQYFVDNTLFFKKNHYVHRQLLYGFSDEKEIFYVLSYLKNRKYMPTVTNYEAVPDAVIEYGIKLSAPLHTIRPNHTIYKFSLLRSIEEYSHYLNNTYEKTVDNSGYYLGLKAMEQFYKILRDTSKGIYHNPNTYSILYEHKRLQETKLSIYSELGITDIDNSLKIQANNITWQAHQLLLLFLKNEIRFSPSFERSSYKLLDSIINEEREFYKRLIDLLTRYL